MIVIGVLKEILQTLRLLLFIGPTTPQAPGRCHVDGQKEVCYSSFVHVSLDGLATIVVMGDCLRLSLGRADPLPPSHASNKKKRLIDKR